MGSFYDTELKILAVLLSLAAAYVHYPTKWLPKWLHYDSNLATNISANGDNSGKDFVNELEKSVRNTWVTCAMVLTSRLTGEESNFVLWITNRNSVSGNGSGNSKVIGRSQDFLTLCSFQERLCDTTCKGNQG